MWINDHQRVFTESFRGMWNSVNISSLVPDVPGKVAFRLTQLFLSAHITALGFGS